MPKLLSKKTSRTKSTKSKLTIKIYAQDPLGKSSSEDYINNSNKKHEIVYSPKENLLELYVGKEPDIPKLRKVTSDAPWKDIVANEIVIVSKDLNAEELETIYEVIELKSYVFDNYKTSDNATRIEKIEVQGLKFPRRAKLISTIK